MANPEIYVKAPWRGRPNRPESILIEIGRLIERHELKIEDLGWSRDVGFIIVQFPSDADLIAFKLLCPFEMMNKTDGLALLKAKFAENDEI